MGKISSERIASSEAKRRLEVQKSHREEWEHGVESKSLEEQLEMFIHEHPIDAENKAKMLCPLLPNDQCTKENYLRILMAQHGRIRWLDSFHAGIEPPCYGGLPILVQKERCGEFSKYMGWLNKKLKHTNVEIGDLVFATGDMGDGDIYTIEQSCGMIGGKYIWEKGKY